MITIYTFNTPAYLISHLIYGNIIVWKIHLVFTITVSTKYSHGTTYISTFALLVQSSSKAMNNSSGISNLQLQTQCWYSKGNTTAKWKDPQSRSGQCREWVPGMRSFYTVLVFILRNSLKFVVNLDGFCCFLIWNALKCVSSSRGSTETTSLPPG